MSVESNEVKGCFVPCQVTLNLLLFTVSFTIFLEIEFDFIFLCAVKIWGDLPLDETLVLASEKHRDDLYTLT